ncbi:hypothetical protein FGO68_gene17803 [Halteria grandinella]|uniref:Uncharacterized protein n=1 Tax=Halteria grandinella TaxID=5974 RepID=A0A8J8T6A0_HALGN|nr:hypothetical protein FGO68_gene17803 [Halteria grandinella]
MSLNFLNILKQELGGLIDDPVSPQPYQQQSFYQQQTQKQPFHPQQQQPQVQQQQVNPPQPKPQKAKPKQPQIKSESVPTSFKAKTEQITLQTTGQQQQFIDKSESILKDSQEVLKLLDKISLSMRATVSNIQHKAKAVLSQFQQKVQNMLAKSEKTDFLHKDIESYMFKNEATLDSLNAQIVSCKAQLSSVNCNPTAIPQGKGRGKQSLQCNMVFNPREIQLDSHYRVTQKVQILDTNQVLQVPSNPSCDHLALFYPSASTCQIYSFKHQEPKFIQQVPRQPKFLLSVSRDLYLLDLDIYDADFNPIQQLQEDTEITCASYSPELGILLLGLPTYLKVTSYRVEGRSFLRIGRGEIGIHAGSKKSQAVNKLEFCSGLENIFFALCNGTNIKKCEYRDINTCNGGNGKHYTYEDLTGKQNYRYVDFTQADNVHLLALTDTGDVLCIDHFMCQTVYKVCKLPCPQQRINLAPGFDLQTFPCIMIQDQNWRLQIIDVTGSGCKGGYSDECKELKPLGFVSGPNTSEVFGGDQKLVLTFDRSMGQVGILSLRQ